MKLTSCTLTDFEFKMDIVKILKELRENRNSSADSYRKEPENIRRNQEKSENAFAEIQPELKEIKTRMNNAEEQISDMEDRIMETTDRKPNKKNDSNLRDLWDNIKRANLCIVGIPEEETEKGIENIFEEIMAENFPNERILISRYRKDREPKKC